MAPKYSLDDIFRSLSDPIRREIFQMLIDNPDPIPLSVIADQFKITRQGVSKHLKQLEDSSLIGSYTEGRQKYYQPSLAPLWDALDFINTLTPEVETKEEVAIEQELAVEEQIAEEQEINGFDLDEEFTFTSKAGKGSKARKKDSKDKSRQKASGNKKYKMKKKDKKNKKKKKNKGLEKKGIREIKFNLPNSDIQVIIGDLD